MTTNEPELWGGVVLSFLSGDVVKKAFIRSDEARLVVELGPRTMVGEALGYGIGVASVHGRLATLVDFDPSRLAHRSSPQFGIFCELESGEAVLVTGALVLATGRYPAFHSLEPAEPPSSRPLGGIVFEGEPVEALHVGSLYHRVEMRVWESRALSPDPRPPPSRRGELR